MNAEDPVMENIPKQEEKWYYKPWAIVVAILCFGPLGLIPLWFRPRTKVYIKIGISVIVIAVTIWCARMTVATYGKLMEYYQELSLIMQDQAGKS